MARAGRTRDGAGVPVSQPCPGALFLLINMQRRGWLGWPRVPSAKNWLAESVPLGLGDVLRGLCWQIDTVLLGLLQPAAVVGFYSVAYRPLGPINWLPLGILTAMFPSFARMARDNRDALQKTFASSIRLLWIASLPLGVFFCLCAETVILLLAGPDYREAAQPCALVIWITSLSFMSYPFRYLFTALGRPRLYAVLVLLMLTTQGTISLTLIPRWGYWGACTGSVVAESLFTTAGLILCYRLGVGGIEWSRLAVAAFAAVGMAGLLWPARTLAWPLLAVTAMAATAVYLALCILLGAVPGMKCDVLPRRWDGIVTIEKFFATLPANGFDPYRGQAMMRTNLRGL